MVGGLVTNTRKRPCLWGGLPRISPECAGDGTLAAKPEPGAIVIAEPRSWREIRRRLGTSYATRLGGHRSVLACQPLRGSTQRLLFRVNVLTAVGRPRSTNCGAPISMLLAGGAKRSGGPDGGSCAVTNLTGRRATWWPGKAGWRGAAATSENFEGTAGPGAGSLTIREPAGSWEGRERRTWGSGTGGWWSWGLVELQNFEAKGKRIRISLFVWLFVVCLPSRLVLCEARPPKSPPADDQSLPRIEMIEGCWK